MPFGSDKHRLEGCITIQDFKNHSDISFETLDIPFWCFESYYKYFKKFWTDIVIQRELSPYYINVVYFSGFFPTKNGISFSSAGMNFAREGNSLFQCLESQLLGRMSLIQTDLGIA